jgi:hypothetical protein
MRHIIFIILFTVSALSQVGIGTTTPNTILDINSTTSGILIPRMTEAQKTSIVGLDVGELIYQTDNITGFYYYDGVTWLNIDNQTANEVDYNNAGSNLVSTNVGDAINEVNSKITLYNVGDSHLGGIVYYTWDNGLHGLIVSPNEIRDTFWGDTASNKRTYGQAQGLGSGKSNTGLIMSKHTTLNNAAAECYNHQVIIGGVTYGGWYLPSVEELELMHPSINIINPLLNDIIDNTGGKSYWSSSEMSQQRSHYVTFHTINSVLNNDMKSSNIIHSRAIKQF